MERISGKPVTDEQIQVWADEAERGYDIEDLSQRSREPVEDGSELVIPVRLDEAILAAIDARAEQDDVSRSETIRAAIRDYVA